LFQIVLRLQKDQSCLQQGNFDFQKIIGLNDSKKTESLFHKNWRLTFCSCLTKIMFIQSYSTNKKNLCKMYSFWRFHVIWLSGSQAGWSRQIFFPWLGTHLKTKLDQRLELGTLFQAANAAHFKLSHHNYVKKTALWSLARVFGLSLQLYSCLMTAKI